MTHLPQQIAPLKSWDEFEDLCCALFQKEWQNPLAQKHGRRGQPQNGVDVFGQNKLDGGKWYGVQCKGKDANYGGKLTQSEIKRELKKADTFSSKLAHWIIATTAAVDVKLQEHARKLTDQRKALGLCPVTVFGWGDIETLLLKHLDVTRRFYPSHFEHLAPSPKFHMPQVFHLSEYFSDPLNHLQNLRQQLLEQGETALLAKTSVQGMGGVGKTQLALKYSHVFKDSYSGVWWFGAETQGGLEADCILFCEKQGIPLAKNEAPGGAVRDWLAGQNNWLLVYDNAEDVKMVRQFLPQTGRHHVLLTSRNPHWDGMKSLPLGVWDEEQAMLFLRARLGQGIGSDDELKALSKALDGLPLALEQACAYILVSKMSVAKYIAALAKHETATRLLNREDASGCHRSVLATLLLAFDQLSAAAQELLKLCSWMAAEPIPAYLFTEQPDKLPSALRAVVQDEIAWRDTLAELERYALCQIESVTLTDHLGNPGEGVDCLNFHRLTQAVARVGGSGIEAFLVLALPSNCREPESFVRSKALLPHVSYMTENYQEQWDMWAQLGRLLNQQAVYLQYGPALYETALPLSQKALAIAERNLGLEHPLTGMRLNNLAKLYCDMGEYVSALPLYQRALRVAEKVHGSEHPVTGVCLNSLAELYREIGNYEAALPLFQRTLSIVEKVQGPEHPNAGNSLNNLALLHEAVGEYDTALSFFLRALAILEKAKGPEHPDTVRCLNNLAELYRVTGKHAAALPLYQRALEIAEKVHGPEHPGTGTILNNLALLYEDMGDYGAALAFYQRALAIAEKTLGPEHPNSKLFRFNLAGFQAEKN